MALIATVCAFPFCGKAQIPPGERQALEIFFLSTGGFSWLRRDGWLRPGVSECRGWLGVRCNESGTHVIALELPANGLTGRLPPQIGDLSHLELLHLDRNLLSGSIPEQITKLPFLRELHLHRNRLSGTVPAQWVSQELESINISTNSLSGRLPESVGRLPVLRELRLAGNKLQGAVPGSFARLSAASVIDLRWNALFAETEELTRFLDLHSPDRNMLNTQTLPPKAITASSVSPGVTRLTWRPPLYTANEGGYNLAVRFPSGFEQKIRVSPKASSTYFFTGLSPGNYSVEIATFTNPHASNQNEVVSPLANPVHFAVTGPTPNPGVISFFPTLRTVAEGEHAIVLVYRSGGQDGNVSVRLRAVPGSAGLEDLNFSSRILAWANGEASFKLLAISTVADNKVEGPESIALALDQPQGGVTVGPFSTASLEILDGDVSGFGEDPVFARDSEGNGLFVWVAPEANGTTAVFGRFADPTGRPIGDSFQISEESPDLDESNPGAISVKTDHFEVAWQHKRGAVRRCVVRIRGGVTLGKQLPVSSRVAPKSLTVSGDPDSQRFAVAWASGRRILGRLFDEEERPGPTLRIDGPEPGWPRRPALAFSSQSKLGLFLWEQEETGGDVDIWGRLITIDGIPSEDEFQVNRETAGYQTLPQVTATKSGFFAVWRSTPLGYEDPSGTELRGIPIPVPHAEPGAEFRINREAIGSQDTPTLTTNESGDCVVAWLREGAEINGLFLRTLKECRDDGPAEQPVRVFRNRPVRTPSLFPTVDATGIVFGIVERDGGIGVETVRGEP